MGLFTFNSKASRFSSGRIMKGLPLGNISTSYGLKPACRLEGCRHLTTVRTHMGVSENRGP